MNGLYILLLSLLMFALPNDDKNNQQACEVMVYPSLSFAGCGNKVFKLETDCPLNYTHTWIFNRHGDMVFDEKGNKEFVGESKGEPLPDGIYYYFIYYQIKNEPDTLSLDGYVHIYR